jgi:excisionase family DNA binding protein
MSNSPLAAPPTDDVQIPHAFQDLLLTFEEEITAGSPAQQAQLNFGSKLLGVRETAARLGVHENTVRQWQERGVLRAIKLPGSGFRRFAVEDVDRMRAQMLGQMAPADPEEPREREHRPEDRRIVHGDDV